MDSADAEVSHLALKCLMLMTEAGGPDGPVSGQPGVRAELLQMGLLETFFPATRSTHRVNGVATANLALQVRMARMRMRARALALTKGGRAV